MLVAQLVVSSVVAKTPLCHVDCALPCSLLLSESTNYLIRFYRQIHIYCINDHQQMIYYFMQNHLVALIHHVKNIVCSYDFLLVVDLPNHSPILQNLFGQRTEHEKVVKTSPWCVDQG